MARNKQEGPELKLYEIDTMQYLTRKNIAYGVTALVEFGRRGCLPIANNIGLSVGKAMERFKDAFNPADIVNGNASGSAYDTWLRKNGLLDSQDGKYQLSELGYALSSSMITDREYCFLLLSKQWIKITDVGSQIEYKKNLLAFLFDTLKNGGEPISESSFVSAIGQQSLNLYDANYQDLKISNSEAARFLVDPLKIAEIIDIKEGNIVLHEKVSSLVDDYLKNEEKIKSPSQVGCVEERFWNSFDHGVYDLISDDNRNLYSSVYPNLFKKRSSFSMDSTKQQIFFGAPGTGKSYKIEQFVHHSVNVADSKEVSSQFEKYLNDKLLKSDDADAKKKESVLRLKACVDSELLGTCFSRIIDVPFSKLSECVDVSSIEKLSKLLQDDKDGETFLFEKGTFGNALTALNNYKSFLEDANTSISKQGIPVQTFRSTFHPDYDYAQFVGSYKPTKDANGKITYSFVPQVFANAVKKALENPCQPVYLVIEEINRGNCAQIFGDIFQLLDRDENGVSRYSVDLDFDFAEWLGRKTLRLPSNFNILATMNTSDQSLFPMDSAFKRRFDWEYVPINYDQEKAKNFKVFLDKDKKTWFNWVAFLRKVNTDIYDVTKSEDKQMGEFFVNPKDGETIDLEMFCSKVLFYLWDSVYKDEISYKTIFHFEYEGQELTFQHLFVNNKANAPMIIREMIDHLNNGEKTMNVGKPIEVHDATSNDQQV